MSTFLCMVWEVYISFCFCGTIKRLQAVMGTNNQKMSLFVARENEPTLNAAEQSSGLSIHLLTCIPKLDFITKNWSTSFLCSGLMSCGTTFSCTAKPNSRIWACRKGKNIFDPFSLSSHHQLGYWLKKRSDKLHVSLRTRIKISERAVTEKGLKDQKHTRGFITSSCSTFPKVSLIQIQL